MAKRVSELSKELGISNKLLVTFFAEKHPEFEITDPSKHHGKSFSWWPKEGFTEEQEIRAELDEFLSEHPELAEVARKGKKSSGAKKSVAKPKAKSSEEGEKTPEAEDGAEADSGNEEDANAPDENVPEPEIPAVSASKPASVSAPVAPAPAPAPTAKSAPLPPPIPPRAPVVPPPVPRIPTPAPAAKILAPVPPVPAPAPVAPAPASVSEAPVPPPVPVARPIAKIAPVPPIPAPRATAPTIAPAVPRVPMPAPIPPRVPAPGVVARAPVPGVPPPVPAPKGSLPSAPKEDLKKVTMRAPVVVRDLATALDVRPFRLISELMSMGIFASLNQDLKDEIAIKVAEKYGVELDIHRREKGGAQQSAKPAVEEKPKHIDDEKDKVPRPPVVCVLGHVDHGKTTLLDYYRKSNVTAGEAGGITQHVAAYSVKHGDQSITFLDTPGHAAFSKMRERGAALTDIAVLVVAADDGFMPQTDEALKFAQKNNVALVVAINKVDARGANVDRVKQQMQQRGITSEDWGGTIQCETVSALKGTGMDSLLDAILLQAEIMELKANPKCPAEGTVVEAQMEQGRGPTATVIIQRGTLKPGDAIVCGPNFCRVRALLDEYGKPLKQIAPGCPGRLMGWSGVPSAGAVFSAVKNAREAEKIAEENQYKLRKAIEEEEEQAKAAEDPANNGLSGMELLNTLLAGTNEKVFKVVTKADVDGTLEALNASLEAIKSSRVKLEIVGGSVGPITQSDVNAASAGGATIVAFDVKQEVSVPALLKRLGVKVITHDIIYMLLDMVKEAMADLLDPELKENKVGVAEARVIYPFGKNAFVAGSMVTEGSIRRDFNARVLRKGAVLHTGRIDTLKRFKDDVTEVKAGYECGIRVTGFEDYKEGDLIECFEILKVRPPL